MQLYAIDTQNEIVYAQHARKQEDYFCLECGDRVHARSGPYRQSHFYHISSARPCRQSGKSEEHLAVQLHFLAKLPKNECILEKRFPSINRIADVVWEPMKLIFEVQCSPINGEEVLRRNRDYAKEGYQVVWVMHEKNFNRSLFTAAEKYLRRSPIFYTNINRSGEGQIYDQFDLFDAGVRKAKSRTIEIDVTQPKQIPAHYLKHANAGYVYERLDSWKIHFQGDLIDLTISDLPEDALLLHMQDAQLAFLKPAQKSHLCIRPFLAISNLYKVIFHYMLEKACR